MVTLHPQQISMHEWSPKANAWTKGLQSLCLKKLREFGGKGTARQICDNTGHASELIAPRMNELAALGVIRDTGERINIGRGRPQTVWALVDADTAPRRVTGPGEVTEGNEAPAWFKKFGL